MLTHKYPISSRYKRTFSSFLMAQTGHVLPKQQCNISMILYLNINYSTGMSVDLKLDFFFPSVSRSHTHLPINMGKGEPRCVNTWPKQETKFIDKWILLQKSH